LIRLRQACGADFEYRTLAVPPTPSARVGTSVEPRFAAAEVRFKAGAEGKRVND